MNVKGDFPVLQKNPEVVYLDSACTSLKPMQVIDAEKSYYEEYGACGGRSAHKLARKTSEKLDECREAVGRFVGAKGENVVWTRNATEGLNLVANCVDFSKKRKVVTTIYEHHSVLLPLFKLRDAGKIELVVLKGQNGVVNPVEWRDAIDSKTALVATHNSSNTTSIKQNVREIACTAHDNGALVCIDGAQGVPHYKVDVGKENIDFLSFSGHKMLGPTGIGALVVKSELIQRMPQFLVGGGTVKTVSLDKIETLDNNEKFEAGIQHYAGIMGLAAAVTYLQKLGMDKIEKHEAELLQALLKELQNTGVTIYGEASSRGSALAAFNLKKAQAHELALLLDKENIAVRSGFFCAQPAMQALGAMNGAVRASCYVYNSVDDVKNLGAALKKLNVIY